MREKEMVNIRYDMIELYYLRTRNVNKTFRKITELREEILLIGLPDNPDRRLDLMKLISVMEG